MGATRMPAHLALPGLDDVLELAALEHDPARWDARLDAMRLAGVPMNDGAAPAAPAGEQAPPVADPEQGTPVVPAPPAPPAPTAGTPPPPVEPLNLSPEDEQLVREASDPVAVSNALKALRNDIKDVRSENKALRRERDIALITSDLGVPADVLTGETAEQLRASAQTFIQHRDAYAQAQLEQAQAATAGQSGGARPRPVPKDLDEQIAEAQKNDDWALVTQLNAQKLAAVAAKTTP